VPLAESPDVACYVMHKNTKELECFIVVLRSWSSEVLRLGRGGGRQVACDREALVDLVNVEQVSQTRVAMPHKL
jgi:hypothetical protein